MRPTKSAKDGPALSLSVNLVGARVGAGGFLDAGTAGSGVEVAYVARRAEMRSGVGGVRKQRRTEVEVEGGILSVGEGESEAQRAIICSVSGLYLQTGLSCQRSERNRLDMGFKELTTDEGIGMIHKGRQERELVSALL